jgi:hypothetical protein
LLLSGYGFTAGWFFVVAGAFSSFVPLSVVPDPAGTDVPAGRVGSPFLRISSIATSIGR